MKRKKDHYLTHKAEKSAPNVQFCCKTPFRMICYSHV